MIKALLRKSTARKPYSVIQTKTFSTTYFDQGDPFIDEIKKMGIIIFQKNWYPAISGFLTIGIRDTKSGVFLNPFFILLFCSSRVMNGPLPVVFTIFSNTLSDNGFPGVCRLFSSGGIFVFMSNIHTKVLLFGMFIHDGQIAAEVIIIPDLPGCQYWEKSSAVHWLTEPIFTMICQPPEKMNMPAPVSCENESAICFQIMEIMAPFPNFGNKKLRQKHIGRRQLNPLLSISVNKMQN